MKKAKELCVILSVVALLCCLTGMELSVAASNMVPTQGIYHDEYLYFSSKYIPLGINARAINSSELFTTAGLPLDEYWRVDDEMDDDFYDSCVEAAAEYITDENDILDNPTYVYNCHYYAWYSLDIEYEVANDKAYWIDSPEPFIKDAHSQEIDEDDICTGDIVVYWSGPENNKSYEHSAVIEDIEYVNGEPVITCISKWGPSGLYRHNIDNVPDAYKNYDIYYDFDEEQFYISYYTSVTYYRYTQGEHFLSVDEDNAESGHTLVCTAEKEDEYGDIQTCSYTTECDSVFSYTSVNSSYHRIYCPDCYYSDYIDHDLYMYSAAPEDYVVKCRDCTYTVECWESPEYYGDSENGHWVDCPDGCYSFFEPHTPGNYYNTEEGYHEIECADCGYLYTEDCSYGSSATSRDSYYHFYECTYCGYERAEVHTLRRIITNSLYTHDIKCSKCNYSIEENHTWIRKGTGYRCLSCGKNADLIPADVANLPDEELALYLTSLTDEELEAFLASLPEDQLARVTAILPPDDEHLTE